MYGNVNSVVRFEEEAKLLDRLAKEIDIILDFGAAGTTTIRHNVGPGGAFNCYVGTIPQDKCLVVKRRYSNALDWSEFSSRRWVIDVANKWLEANGSPHLVRGGNRLPRPVEETLTSVGNQPEPINRNG